MDFQKMLDALSEFASNNIFWIIFIAFILSFIEALFPILPLIAIVSFDIVMFCAVFDVVTGTTVGILVSIVGSFCGTVLVYIILSKSIGKWINRKVEDMVKVKNAILWIENRTNLFLVFLLSNPYAPTSVFNYALALTNFPLKRYLIITAISRVICVGLLGFLGAVFNIGTNVYSFIWICLTYIIIFIIIWLIKKILNKNKEKTNEKNDN